MKRVFFSLVILSLVFTACPPLEEDNYIYYEATMTYDGALDYQKWIEILEDVGNQKKYIKLDLQDCTYVAGNGSGGLINVTLHNNFDGNGNPIPNPSDPAYITFDPIPAIGWGKDKIVAIVLPDEAKMINQATDKKVQAETEADKKRSAFANFSNLRSVSAENVEIIGNYAFVDNKTLTEVDFPSLQRIDDYAFEGCTNLAKNPL